MSKRRFQRPIMKARQMYVDQRGRSLESILPIPAQEAQYSSIGLSSIGVRSPFS